jgi:glycine/D-amino acid oxidase-like deaminating enzyme
LNKAADVVVIGGGIIGCSVAYHLAKRGAKVTVIEKREGLCLGASGSNQGGVAIALSPPESPLLGLIRESARLYKSLSQEIGYDVDYQQTGLLICGVDEEQRPIFDKHAREMQRKGVDVRVLEGDDIRKLEPVIGEDVVAGVEDWDSGTVNPFKVTHGFAYAARKMGVEFLLATNIYKIEVKERRITSVVTDKGRIATDYIVTAAGAWSPEIGQMVGLTIPVKPQRGQIIVTEPLPFNERWKYICDADYLSIAFNAEAAEKSTDRRTRLGVAGNYVQKNTGTWTIGSSRDFAGYNNQGTMEAISYLAKRMIQFLHKYKEIHCIRTYAGFRPYCYADDHPIISKVDNLSGFLIATGHAGKGVTLAPVTGKLISELITEKRTSMPIDTFCFSRFKNMKNESS